MDGKEPSNLNGHQFDYIEPQAKLLKRPPDGQLLYKVMRVENLLKSISGAYLHFNRVDSYKDFPGADPHDGEQLPKDQSGNENTKFIKSPTFSVSDLYNRSRERTYACCFSTENSDSIWLNFGNGGTKGKVCLVFEFGKLRSTLNKTWQSGNSQLKYNGTAYEQIFSINYGLVEYVEWKVFQANKELIQNPIKYTYFKDKKWEEEKELRISLSTFGMPRKFILKDGSTMKFSDHFPVSFNFGPAMADGTIQEILHLPDCDLDFLFSELQKLGIDTNN